jgi:hypothetical protein
MMRGQLLVVPFLWLVLAASPARAGIYLTDEKPLLPLPTDFHPIRLALIGYREIPLEKVRQEDPTSIRTTYRGLLARLEESKRQGTLLLPDRIDLGALYLRLSSPGAINRYRDAKLVLEEAERQSPESWSLRFLLFANLAATYHGLAESEQQPLYFDQAIAYQKRALAVWPDAYPVWRFDWVGQNYRRAELFYLRLLEVRREEQRRRPTARGFEQVDDLFTGVRFVGPGGEYQAGKIARESWDLLPPDAPQIVLQLIYWFPYDDRLYWLFGEILNSRNQVREAHAVLNELVAERNLRNVRDLNRHRLILQETAESIDAVLAVIAKNPSLTPYLVMALSPRGSVAITPGFGSAMLETASPAVEYYVQEMSQRQQQEQLGGPAPGPPRGQREWGAIFGGFLLGILVGILGVWQVRQWRLRHAASQAERRLPVVRGETRNESQG